MGEEEEGAAVDATCSLWLSLVDDWIAPEPEPDVTEPQLACLAETDSDSEAAMMSLMMFHACQCHA